MLTAPYDHPTNLVMQGVMNYLSYALSFVLLAYAVHLGRKQRTPYYVILVLAVGLGAFLEPIYDVTMMLLFYVPGIVSHFTAFEIPQPLWTHSGYVVLYAVPALCIGDLVYRGRMTPRMLYGFALLEFAMSCAFEMLGINFGTYSYWGPHVLRVFDYPLVAAVLESAQTICFAVAAANLRVKVTGPTGLLGLFVLFPLTMVGVNQGVGFPLVVSLHLQNTTPAIVTAGTLLAVAAALIVIRGATLFLPARVEQAVEEGQDRRAILGSC